MTMVTIKEKLARAKSDYKDAIATLDNVRQTYQASGGAYSRAQERQQMLNSKIAAADTDLDNANQLIRRQLEKNHFVKTEAVRSAMLEKAEAEAIKAELQSARQAGELPTLKLKIEASRDAQDYKTADLRAHDAYARVQVYGVLVSYGPEFSRAMALMSHVEKNPEMERLLTEEQLRELRIEFVWKELKEMALHCTEADRRPHVVEIGMLEMGPFADGKFVTPLEAAKLRKALEKGQAIE